VKRWTRHAWPKLDRSSEHIDELEERVERWLGTDAYTIAREKDPKTGYTLCRAKIKTEPPVELSLVAGDIVQNLRAALDHVVYALAERHSTLTPEIEGGLMFPIIGHINSKGVPSDGADIFKNELGRGRLAGVPAKAVQYIETEQPYYHDHARITYMFTALWRLHDLSRIDKHRRLAVTTAFLHTPIVGYSGPDPEVRFFQADGPVDDDDPLVAFSGAEEGVNAILTRDVALDEGPTRTGIVADLRGLKDRVERIVRVLERFL
jgi:hypothetical protein